jgi:hypothetical protein
MEGIDCVVWFMLENRIQVILGINKVCVRKAVRSITLKVRTKPFVSFSTNILSSLVLTFSY